MNFFQARIKHVIVFYKWVVAGVRRNHPKVFCKKGSLEAMQNSSESMCLDFILVYSLHLYKKRDSETGAFLLILKNTFVGHSSQLLLKRLKTQILESLTRAFRFYMSRFNVYFEKFLIFSS